MATATKSFSNLTGNGSDFTIGSLTGLPSIPSNADLDSVYLTFDARRDNGNNNSSGKVRIEVCGNTSDVKTGMSRNTTYSGLSVNLTGYIKNNNGTLTYTDGTTSVSIRGYHDWYWNGQSNWTISNIVMTATYTIRNTYVTYDSIFSFKKWADTGLKSWTLMNISNVTDIGFTGTALANDAYTENSEPVMNVTAGKSYTVDFDASYPPTFQLFVFFTDANGVWNGSLDTLIWVDNKTTLTFTPNTNYIVIRCDIDGTGNVNTFSNFRIYPTDCPYMSTSVSAAERTDLNSWSMPTPTRTGYKFKGWNTKPDGTGTTYTSSSAFPTSDLVLYSQWEILKYTVTFKDENGATLKTETVNYDSTVTAPTDPVKDDTAQHKYTFDGWYDANGNKWYPNTAITGDTVYTARFNSTVQRYTVKWYNEDGSVLLETDELVPYGDKPDYNGATPTKAETAAATYEHIGWSINVNSSGTTELTAVIEAVNYYARFRAIDKTYTVVWKNDDGTVLETDTAVAYGDKPDYNGSTPTKDDEQFVYTFLGWSANVEDPPLDDTELPTVTGNITYTAVYEKTPKIFLVTVTMLTNKGDTLGEYLMRVTEYGRELVIEAEENAGYRFVKWTDGNTDRFRTITVTASVDYEAIYERVPVPIIVNEEQRVTGVYIVPASQTIVYVISGEVPAVVANGVTVDGWSFEVSNSVPDNSYPIEKLFINETRVY